MPRVTFVRDFCWSPRPQVTLAFRAGTNCLVTQSCARAAAAQGALVPAPAAAAQDEENEHGARDAGR